MSKLMSKSPEFWIDKASLDALYDAIREIETWTDDEAGFVDGIYMARTEDLIRHTNLETAKRAGDLQDHIARVSHDGVRDQLNALNEPYAARWQVYTDLLEGVIERADVPLDLLGRKHVVQVLERLVRANGRLPQGELDMIANEGQRSSLLKLMEHWELIARVPGPGRSRIVTITDLGRVAIGDTGALPEPVAVTPEPSTTWKPSFTTLMYQGQA